MNYYIYTNWKATDREDNKIHHWSCGNCRMGMGKHKDADKGEHGVWIGPFMKRKQAKEFSKMYFTNIPISNCKHCNKK